MASTTGQKFAVHGRHNISWQDMPAPSFYSISSESGSGSGERGKEARANKRNDIILQAKGTTGDESGAAAGVGDGGGVGRGAGTRTKNRSAVRRLGDTYAIEIKPKQGWLQLASDVNDLFDLMPSGAVTKPKETTCNQEENEPSARDKCWCRFCSMQLLKMHNGKIKRLGHYCPLDLFSGYVDNNQEPGTRNQELTLLGTMNRQLKAASFGTNIES